MVRRVNWLREHKRVPDLAWHCWYLVRRDHSLDGGWHPVNDDLVGTATYGDFSSDAAAQSTFSVPFGDAFTEYLLASGDMSMWVTITKAELAGRCGSCANCVMELTGSSHMDEPKQYCRAGSGEDPWISAGDHPDLIVYGEMSWSSHHLGQDGSEDALHRGGSNVWINALPSGAAPAPAPSGGDSCVGDVCGTVAQTSTDGAGTTYRLSLTLSGSAKNVYTIYGDETSSLSMPPSYQEAAPFGANTGGMFPFTNIMPY